MCVSINSKPDTCLLYGGMYLANNNVFQKVGAELSECKYFVVCNQIKIKITHSKFIEKAVSLFCDGFPKYNGDTVDCAIYLYIDDRVVVNEDEIIREYKNDIFECRICGSLAEYRKKEKIAHIFFSSNDLMGSSGKPNYNMVYFLLTEVITRLLIDHGFAAYHASSISLNGKAIVFMGESMSGKTTLSLKLASKGYCYLGDDRVFIKNKQVYSYPKPLHIAHDVRFLFEADYYTERKRGKSFIPFKKYIKEEYIVSDAKIACVFLICKDENAFNKVKIKNIRGLIYGLNSLFYCEEEFSILLDSIIEMDEIPVYALKNEYNDSQVESIHETIQDILLQRQ